MDIRNLIKSPTIESFSTPSYLFDVETFKKEIKKCTELFHEIPITYSIKANPFLTGMIGNDADHLEVCSPGELEICIIDKVPGKNIIYSGVNKEKKDIKRAIEYGCDILTAESPLHVTYEQETALELGCKIKVLLRLTGGNQFGMSSEAVKEILANRNNYPNIEFMGFHFYSGTQKKLKQIAKDIELLKAFLAEIKENLGFAPKLVEYGPGFSYDYFGSNTSLDDELKNEIAMINEFAKEWPLGLEFGRFVASSCGYYVTSVMDIKQNDGVNYAICDGGIHQIRYYGQTLAMQVPEIEVIKSRSNETYDKTAYCLCGSLCTVADVLVREVNLPELEIGDILVFKNCGAYSMTEGNLMFLSRDLPAVYLVAHGTEITRIRDNTCSYQFNSERK